MLNDIDLPHVSAWPDLAWQWLIAIGLLALGVGVALLAHKLLFRVLLRLAAASHSKTDDIVALHLRKPTRWALIALGLVLAARETPLLSQVWEKLAGFVMPALIGWMALAAFKAFVEAACVSTEYHPDDDMRNRRRRTRLAIFSRIATFIIIFITVGLMLLSVPGVREIGVTLMASAGIGALAVGAAAQPALKSLIAGIQMAITEPISIGDLVQIGGDGGTVEDIRSSFVVVRTWDDRRLVVPTSKFLDETFENWSRNGTQLQGPAYLHLDPTADIAPIRAEFDRLVEAHPKWDKRNKSLQVVEMTPSSIQVRFVVSATTSGDLWDLRADVREALLAFIRDQQPSAFAFQRIEKVQDQPADPQPGPPARA